MCAKKKAAPNRTWRLAGEPLRFAPLTMYERQRITDEFLDYKGLIRADWLPDGICVTSNEAKIIESATMTVSSYLCDRFAGRYEREAIVVAVATMTAVPTKASAEAGKLPTFLMGAALWLLDYLEEICEDPEEYLSILPLEPDMVLDYAMPFADDLNHSHDTILRMLAVLDGREGAYRKNFRNLLRMVSEDTAMQLRGLFRDSLVDFMDRTLTVCQTLNIPPWEPQPVNLLVPHNSPDEFRDEHPAIRFLHMVHELICQPVPIIRKRLNSRKAAELVSGYSTSDPYALCMAFLLLEKEKDVLANLNALTAVVMICAMRHLPWAQDDLAARAGLFQSGPRLLAAV